MTDDGPNRHPVAMFDTAAKAVFTSAQTEGERRGGNVLVSGLILFAAAKSGDAFAVRLLGAMGTDIDSLTNAVDVEWNVPSSVWMQDQPVTLIREAFESVAAEAEPDAELGLASLLGKFLGYPDSMASRVARRIGVEPTVLADRLRFGTES